MSVNREDVKKLARLARLRLTDAEEEETVTSLNAILSLLDDLEKADVEGIDAMAYVHGHGLKLRHRQPEAVTGFTTEDLLKNAPKSARDYFVVPKVIE